MTRPDQDSTKPAASSWKAEQRRSRQPYLVGLLLFLFLAWALGRSLHTFGWVEILMAFSLTTVALVLFFVGQRVVRGAAEGSLSFRFGMRHLMVFVGVAAVVFQLIRTLGWSLLWLIALFLPPFVVVGAWLLFRSGARMQQDGLVAVMGMAARRGLPLGPAISAYAGLCRGSYRNRALMMARGLDNGLTLPQALGRSRGLVPPETAALVLAGWDTNQLGPALERAREARRIQRRDAAPIRRVLAYPAFVLWYVVSIVSFLGYNIFPKMTLIARDFGLPMPRSSVVAGQILEVVMLVMTVVVVVIVDVLLLLGLFWVLLWLVRFVRESVGSSDPGRWSRPRRWRWWRPFSRDRAAVLRSLALGVEGGLPMIDVMKRLARSELGSRACRASRKVADDLRAGRPWIASLARRRLIRPVDASVLASAERVGNLAWSLRERADAIDRLRNLRLRAFAIVLQPLSVIALGGLVLLVAFTYFVPLVALISMLVNEI